MRLKSVFCAVVMLASGCLPTGPRSGTLQVPQSAEDFVTALPDRETLFRLSEVDPTNNLRSLKFLVDLSTGNHYFQNSRKFHYHFEFLTKYPKELTFLREALGTAVENPDPARVRSLYDDAIFSADRKVLGGVLVWSEDSALKGPPAYLAKFPTHREAGKPMLGFDLYLHLEGNLTGQDDAADVRWIAHAYEGLRQAVPFMADRIVHVFPNQGVWLRNCVSRLAPAGVPSLFLQDFFNKAGEGGTPVQPGGDGESVVALGDVTLKFGFRKRLAEADTYTYDVTSFGWQNGARNETLTGTALQSFIGEGRLAYGKRHHNSCDTLAVAVGERDYVLVAADLTGNACRLRDGARETETLRESGLYFRYRSGGGAWTEKILSGCKHFFSDCDPARAEIRDIQAGGVAGGATEAMLRPEMKPEARTSGTYAVLLGAQEYAELARTEGTFTMLKYVLDSGYKKQLFYFDSKKFKYHQHFVRDSFIGHEALTDAQWKELVFSSGVRKIWSEGTVQYNPRAQLSGMSGRGALGFDVMFDGNAFDIAEVKAVFDKIRQTTDDVQPFHGGRIVYLFDNPQLQQAMAPKLAEAGIPSTDFSAFWR